MKVHILDTIGNLTPLICRLELEGEEIVDEREGELFIRGEERLAEVIQQTVADKVEKGPESFTLARRWNGKGWERQGVLGLPVRGWFLGGLGPSVITGSTCCGVGCEGSIAKVFQDDRLEAFLLESGHLGWVTVGIGPEGSVCSIHLGLPFFQIYNVLHASGGFAGSYLSNPRPIPDFWTVSLLVARWPFPSQGKFSRIVIPIDEGLSGHFWPWCRQRDFSMNSFSTTDGRIGIATNWGRSLDHAWSFAEQTCRAISCPEKIFHLGGFYETLQRWQDLRGAGVV